MSTLQSANLKGSVAPIHIDVTDDATVDAAAKSVEQNHGHLDVLVNNAGISNSGASNVAIRENIATNTVGPVVVTNAFAHLLRNSADPRLIFVGSSLGSLVHASNPASPYYQSKAGSNFMEYRASKAALNMLMIEYNKALKPDGIKVWTADPGLLATNLVNAEAVRKLGAPGPEVGGELVASVIRGERDADVGKVIGRYGTGEW